jgi:hypothetical protein
MTHLIWPVIAVASGLLFGQMQSWGPGPDEKMRAEKMLSQGERMIAQNDLANRLSRIAIAIALLALVVAVIALFRPH